MSQRFTCRSQDWWNNYARRIHGIRLRGDWVMFREKVNHQRLVKSFNTTTELAEMVRQLVQVCQNCETASPMICVQQCAIWKSKNDFMEFQGAICTSNHFQNLLNALKNGRRRATIKALSERPYSIRELQEYLKHYGYYHSQRTIANEYIGVLVNVGLVKKNENKYRLTLVGRKVNDLLENNNGDSLPTHSNCYEETMLRMLSDGPKTYADLAGMIGKKRISRSIKRLVEKGMVIKNKIPSYVFYFRTKKEPKKVFSPTEERIYRAIPDIGISARQLSIEVKINLRRIYKYLRRLRKRRLVFTRKRPRTYELTASGRETADFLEETMNLMSDASEALNSLLVHTKEPMITTYAPS